ncbi:hypothetical protein BaRGS_00013134 [Batillaria attramentaria]|uniref:Uncharacterized protein n=1 Tax=Batillaria attramentaria TaxID=370345 RepID=A0ABD0L970_9CAEN
MLINSAELYVTDSWSSSVLMPSDAAARGSLTLTGLSCRITTHYVTLCPYHVSYFWRESKCWQFTSWVYIFRGGDNPRVVSQNTQEWY